MSLSSLSPKARSVVCRYAQCRGISEDNFNEFLNPKLNLGRHKLPHAEKAAARWHAAVANNERAVIFGDYDADGVTSVAILLRFFAECTSLRPAWKLPNRTTDHYGLEIEMARKIVAEFQPTLLIAIDNGTNSVEAVSWLRQHGIETIIVDHHPVTTPAQDSVAIINPKAHEATLLLTPNLKERQTMATEKQTRYILLLLAENGYSTRFMDSQFKELGATMRERSGTVEDWARSLDVGRASQLIGKLAPKTPTT